jgi:ATPase subunit of ABC transporter with duplicated ATPase domains
LRVTGTGATAPIPFAIDPQTWTEGLFAQNLIKVRHQPCTGTAATEVKVMAQWEEYEDLEANSNMAEVKLIVTSTTVSVTSRKMKAHWTPELAQDLAAYHSIDAEAELTALLSEELAAEIDRLLHLLETDHSDNVLNALHDAQSHFEALDGYQLRSRSESVLEGLGFTTTDLVRPLNEFSGGWRMRVMLAKILLGQPDLLVLDEPTNHLDLPSIEWIEEYLDNYEGTVVIVSHDRFFLDRVVTKIAEISNSKITTYTGNYSFYVEAKELSEDMQRSQFKNQEKYLKEENIAVRQKI